MRQMGVVVSRSQGWKTSVFTFLFIFFNALLVHFNVEAQVTSATQVLQLGTPNLSVEQGQTAIMAMRWNAVRLSSNYTVFVHFIGENGSQYSGGDHAPSVPTSTWSGAVNYNHSRLIPSSMPVGNYQIRVGLYSGSTRVTLSPGPGVIADDQQRYTVGTLNVRAPGSTAPQPQPQPQPVPTQSTVNMLSNPNLTVAPGGTVTMGMRFNGVPMSANHTVFVHFVGANGAQYPGGDHAPAVPTSTWNGPIAYNHTRAIPTSMPNGTYSIRVGLYSGATRYPLATGAGVTADGETRYTVGTLTVGTAPAPQPEPQPQPQPTQSTVNLLSNPNLTVAPGGTVTMGMRFNGVPMSANHTVFVHFVGANGSQYPGGDHAPAVPTSTWNGPVAYNHTRTIPTTMPTGTYSIRVGLYSGATRYPLAPGAGVTADGETRYTVGTLTVASGTTPTPTPANCSFNGQTVAHGQSVTAYQANSVPAGSTCVSQTRTCNYGTLSGSYQYASCSVQQAPARTQVLMLENSNLTAQAGQSFNFVTRFNAVPMARDYVVFVHFVNSSGQNAFGSDYSPSTPTTQWSGVVQTQRTATVPSGLAAGRYTVRMGLYENVPPYTNRAQLDMGSGVTVDDQFRYAVGTLTVTAPSTPTVPSGQILDYYGDSTVWGYRTNAGGQVAKPAPAAFAERLPQVQVRNEGVSGSTACQLLNGTDGKHPNWNTQMANSNATVIILNHAINDQWAYDLATYKSCLTNLAQIARSRGKKVIFETPNPTRDNVGIMANAMKEVAAQMSIPVIDQYQYLMNYLNGQSAYTICPDGLHPTEAVYIMKGQYAAQVFQTIP